MEILNDSDAIYEEYRPKVFSYLYYQLNNYHDAEDLTEDVFVKVYSKIDTYDKNKASLSTWIFNVAKNTLIDYYRTRKDNLELMDNVKYVDDKDDMLSPTMLDDLARGLDNLSEDERDIIVLRYYEGYTLKEVSEMMKMSYGICKLKHSNALNKLKNYVTL